jgi:hypothetical protein
MGQYREAALAIAGAIRSLEGVRVVLSRALDLARAR